MMASLAKWDLSNSQADTHTHICATDAKWISQNEKNASDACPMMTIRPIRDDIGFIESKACMSPIRIGSSFAAKQSAMSSC